MSIEKLFKSGEFSIDVVRIILNKLPLERVKVVCGVNKYMNQQVCNDSFWLLYYERMFLGPKPKSTEDELKKLKPKITDLFFYLLNNEQVKYSIIIYKKYKDYIDITRNKNEAIRMASDKGYSELVELLLKDKRVDPTINDNKPMRSALKYHHYDVVKVLLADKRVNPAVYENYAIQLASKYGHADVVKLLLADKRVNPAVYDNYTIQLASKYGHADVVKLLLADKRVNPADDDNSAIKRASEYGHVDVVKLLLGDPRVRNSLSKAELQKYQSS